MPTLIIAGVQVADPAEVQVGRFDLSKSNRTASGRMVMEVVRAGVRRVDVTWRYLPDQDLQRILDVLAANKPFFTLQYPDAGGQKSMTCYAGDIQARLWRRVHGQRYWAEVSISFIEQ